MSKDRNLSRIRSDSIWNSLPAERRATFEGWLFEEHVGYATARERARAEWGVEGSLSSVGKYARRVARRRAVTDLEEMMQASTDVEGAEGKLSRMKASAMKLVGMQLLEKALMRGDIKELAALSRVLTQVEDREIQRGRLKLAREKFEFKAAEAALKEAPSLNRIEIERQRREDEEIDQAKLAIFGRPPPGYEDPFEDELPNAECALRDVEFREIKNEKLKVKNGEAVQSSKVQAPSSRECSMTKQQVEAPITVATAQGGSNGSRSVNSADQNGTNGTNGTVAASAGIENLKLQISEGKAPPHCDGHEDPCYSKLT